MKYYLIAGEKSGDLHAANLMKALLREDAAAVFRYWGGEAMQAVGGTLVKHYQEMAFMGIWEVVKNIRTIRGFLKEAQRDIMDYQPNVVILVDYGGFNMRISKWCKTHHIKNFYYISPKVWAWNTKRALKIKVNVDRMFVIFPFEKAFYKQFDYEVDFVGNPLMDAIQAYQPNEQFLAQNALDTKKKIIALLPGSRKQEIAKIFANMLAVIHQFSQYQFVVAGIGRLPKSFYQSCEGVANVKVVYDQTYDLLAHSHAAIVTSGTATLETALFNVPQVVCYKTSTINYLVFKQLLKVKYISLVNLVMDKEVVKELIQKEFTPDRLTQELTHLLGEAQRAHMLQEYTTLHHLLGNEGASAKTAQLMVKYLQPTP